MPKQTHGIFLHDVHLPLSIKLNGLFKFVEDFKPDVIILGGDIIDAEGMHGCASMTASQVDPRWLKRDVKLVTEFITSLKANRKPDVIYLEGNHEERYRRIQRQFPIQFGEALDFENAVKPLVTKYVPYGRNDSYHIVGDTVFIHGDIYPESHAKRYALRYSTRKVLYGHLHHFQSYTPHRALLEDNMRYAATAGCLCDVNPDWKHGQANQWVNGFTSFFTDGNRTIPTFHMIENGKFAVGRKVYG